ncbi:S8 family serine peptidase [Actinomadura hibisca]|uniref:S8 family serine peptidase n=1 Tax=Actinomadura hibisca TaxID=68565 RepID=UPI000AAE954A|nr:S8 family serine peptidase [Actinomadura hibisca]
MRAAGVVAAGVFLTLAWPVVPTSAAPSPTPKPSTTQKATPPPPPPARCDLPRGYRGTIGESWARKRLGYERVWHLTRGEGVTVAVVDSGVGDDHPMLSGRVAGVVDLTGTGRKDCAGHGTGVAGLIAGRDLSDRKVPLSGVAPEAKLLVVKQQNAQSDESGGDRLPRAIRAAVAGGAKVVNLSIRARHSADLEQAVKDALAQDVVIVAAAGNTQRADGDDGPAYPASYPGVLSVAALGPEGGRAESSSTRSRVDVAAPGKGITVPWPDGGYNPQAEGTSYAAAYVSGVAALVRSHRPGLGAPQVVRRILATADGNTGDATGRGMVNPVQAVTAVVPGEDGSGPAGRRAASAELAAPAPEDGRTRTIATAATGAALAGAALVAVAGLVLPMGRRRGWRPGRADPAARRAEDEPVAIGTEGGTIGARR